jgi:hypothetical protein
MGYHIRMAVAKLPSHAFASRYILLIVILFVGVSSSVTTAEGGRVDRGSGYQDTGWRARIKGGGCDLLRIDELGASAKVTLVMDSSI